MFYYLWSFRPTESCYIEFALIMLRVGGDGNTRGIEKEALLRLSIIRAHRHFGPINFHCHTRHQTAAVNDLQVNTL